MNASRSVLLVTLLCAAAAAPGAPPATQPATAPAGPAPAPRVAVENFDSAAVKDLRIEGRDGKGAWAVGAVPAKGSVAGNDVAFDPTQFLRVTFIGGDGRRRTAEFTQAAHRCPDWARGLKTTHTVYIANDAQVVVSLSTDEEWEPDAWYVPDDRAGRVGPAVLKKPQVLGIGRRDRILTRPRR